MGRMGCGGRARGMPTPCTHTRPAHTSAPAPALFFLHKKDGQGEWARSKAKKIFGLKNKLLFNVAYFAIQILAEPQGGSASFFRFNSKGTDMHDNNSEPFDPAASLRVIRETIEVARRDLSNDGFHFLLWGALLNVTGVCHYWLSDVARVSWSPVPLLLGVPAAFVYEYRRGKRQSAVNNVIRRWYSWIWFGFFVAMTILIVWSQQHDLSPTPLILAVAAFAVFVSGLILRFRPLGYGAGAIWVGSLACLWAEGAQDSLVFSASMVFGYLIPGIMLLQQARKSHVSGA